MTPETRANYELYFDLFGHQGWRMFMDDLEDAIQEINSVEGIVDAKQLHVLQGRIETMRQIQNTQNLMEIAYEQAEGDDA